MTIAGGTMRCRNLILQTVLTAALLSNLGYAQSMLDPVDHSEQPSGSVDVIARFWEVVPSGIVVTPDHRVFLSFPRSAEDHTHATLAELREGKLFPFPNVPWSLSFTQPASERFVSALGITLDQKHRLWVLDEGQRAGKAVEANGAKLVGIDIDSGKVVSTYILHAPVLLSDSHLNDVRVDLHHGRAGYAFISDSSLQHPAMIVLDLASGQQRRVLEHSASVHADPGFSIVLDGVIGHYQAEHPSIPEAGIDGLAVSPDGERVYYQALTSRRLYSIATSALLDPVMSEQQREADVRDEGETGSVDGMVFDSKGNLYLTDIEHHAIVRRSPNGELQILAHDPRLISPDGIAVTADGDLYVTVGQWYRLPVFHNGKDLREKPYIVLRIHKEP